MAVLNKWIKGKNMHNLQYSFWVLKGKYMHELHDNELESLFGDSN